MRQKEIEELTQRNLKRLNEPARYLSSLELVTDFREIYNLMCDEKRLHVKWNYELNIYEEE